MIVFLPGLGFRSSIWDKIKFAFINDEVLFLDFPHFLNTDKKSLEDITDYFSEKIPINSDIIAWSFSGLFAIDFCHRFPKKVRKLILISSTPRFLVSEQWPGISINSSKNFDKIANEDLAFFIRKLINNVRYPSKSHELKSYLYSHVITDPNYLIPYLQILFSEDLREKYQILHHPTLLILGKEDPIVPEKLWMAMEKLNKNLQTKIIEQSGHVSFLTHTDIFSDTLCVFLNAES
jgi:pimeloyl-[acyl-carrier protein] methyl ester esterase